MNDMLAKNLAFLLKGDKAAQTPIAEKVGVTQPTISKWSRLEETESDSEPEFRKMARLASVLKVSLDDLAYRDLKEQGPSVASIPASQPVGLDVGKLVDLLGTVEAAVEKSGIKLAPRVKARLVSTLYVDKEASAAASAQAVQAALVGILATMETVDEPDASR